MTLRSTTGEEKQLPKCVSPDTGMVSAGRARLRSNRNAPGCPMKRADIGTSGRAQLLVTSAESKLTSKAASELPRRPAEIADGGSSARPELCRNGVKPGRKKSKTKSVEPMQTGDLIDSKKPVCKPPTTNKANTLPERQRPAIAADVPAQARLLRGSEASRLEKSIAEIPVPMHEKLRETGEKPAFATSATDRLKVSSTQAVPKVGAIASRQARACIGRNESRVEKPNAGSIKAVLARDFNKRGDPMKAPSEAGNGGLMHVMLMTGKAKPRHAKLFGSGKGPECVDCSAGMVEST